MKIFNRHNYEIQMNCKNLCSVMRPKRLKTCENHNFKAPDVVLCKISIIECSYWISN
jgi:hypothetical protein